MPLILKLHYNNTVWLTAPEGNLTTIWRCRWWNGFRSFPDKYKWPGRENLIKPFYYYNHQPLLILSLLFERTGRKRRWRSSLRHIIESSHTIRIMLRLADLTTNRPKCTKAASLQIQITELSRPNKLIREHSGMNLTFKYQCVKSKQQVLIKCRKFPHDGLPCMTCTSE